MAFLAWSTLVERSVIRDADRRSVEWAEYAAQRLDRITALAEGVAPDTEEWAVIEDLAAFGGVFRFKVFSPEGVLRFESDDPSVSGVDLGSHNTAAAAVVAAGQPFTEVKDGKQKADRPDIYSETYLPVIRNGDTVAILEVYLDQTDKAAAVRDEYAVFGAALASLFVLALAVPTAGVVLLIRRLRCRNAELDAERLHALAADRAKSEFLATVSHELRTPMNGIIGAVQLLDDVEMEEEDREVLEILSTCAEGQMTLIEEILTFGEIEAGAIRTIEEHVELPVLMRASTSFATIGAEKKGLTLDIVSSDDVPAVLSDAKRLRQVIVNLVGNAVKFTETGGVEVRVTVEATGGANGSALLRVSVSDTGPGIATEHRTRIFERFTQGDSSSSRKAGGTGLGLAIARGMARELGGDITLESTVGEGSTFTFELPVRLALAVDTANQASTQHERKVA